MDKKYFARLGSISAGTMRPADLIPTFCWELRHLGKRSTELSRIERQTNRVNDGEYYDSEEASYDLDSLFDMLNEYAPAYCYFGAHPGDGSDYGFWVDENLEYDFDGLKIDDLAEVPEHYTGDILHVNDHGNMTLYTAKNGFYREVWSIV